MKLRNRVLGQLVEPAVTPKMPTLPWMDAIRGVACGIVITWHAFLTIVPADPTRGQQIFSLPFGAMARECVVVFVMLSGYLLGRHWRGGFSQDDLGEKFRTYMLRRTWRMVPPYWAALALAVVLMLLFGLDRAQGSHWDAGLPLTWWRVTVDFLMISDIVGQVPVSHQLWTVPIEYHLYLMAPLVILFRRRWLVLLFGLALTLLVVFALPHFHAPYFVFAFIAAFWLGVRRQSHDGSRLSDTIRLMTPVIGLSLLLVVVVATLASLPQSTGRYFVLDALAGPVFLAWIFHADVSRSRSILIRILSWRWLRWLGQISYSHYLVHAVVLEMVWRFAVRPLDLVGDSANIWAMVVAGYAGSLVVAVAFYRAVELPTARKSSRIGVSRQRLAPTDRVSSEAS